MSRLRKYNICLQLMSLQVALDTHLFLLDAAAFRLYTGCIFAQSRWSTSPPALAERTHGPY